MEYYIVKSRKLNTVEKADYKNLLHVLDPSYVLPGQKKFYKMALPKLYLMCKESEQQENILAKSFATTSGKFSKKQ